MYPRLVKMLKLNIKYIILVFQSHRPKSMVSLILVQFMKTVNMFLFFFYYLIAAVVFIQNPFFVSVSLW